MIDTPLLFLNIQSLTHLYFYNKINVKFIMIILKKMKQLKPSYLLMIFQYFSVIKSLYSSYILHKLNNLKIHHLCGYYFILLNCLKLMFEYVLH